MGAPETVSGLCAFAERRAGSDAERRAAGWLLGQLRERGRQAELDVHWVRPAWPAVHAAHAALGVAASLLGAAHPGPGLVVAALVWLSALLDAAGLARPARRLTAARATQNVVAPPPRGARGRVRLVVTAAYDAPRGGLVHAAPLRRLETRARLALRGHLPGGLGLEVLALEGVAVVLGLRLAGVDGRGLDAGQFGVTALALLVLFALLDVGGSAPSPGANGDASGVGVALELVAALDRAPPRHLDVELLLAGAGDGPALGAQAWVRARRRILAPEEVVVLELGPCGAGRPRWWTRYGAVLPRGRHHRLTELAAQAAREEPHLGAGPFPAARRTTAAAVARRAGWPALTLGCVDTAGVEPGRGTPRDTPDRVDPAAMRAALELALALVEGIDAEVAARSAAPSRPGARRLRRRSTGTPR